MFELCRYMSFQRFCEILFNQELVLVKPEMWNDKYEKYIFQVINNDEGKNKVGDYLREKCNFTEDKVEEMLKFIKLICDSTHCLCFSKSIDAEVMWNAYSYNSQSIMMITTSDALENLNSPFSLDFDLRQVHYDLEKSGLTFLFDLLKSDDKGVSIVNSHHFFTHKRKCFEYEDEFRIIVTSPKSSEKRFLSYHIYDLSVFIKGIMVHPLAADNYVSLIQTMCNKFNINFLGKSKIYDFDVIY